LPGFELVVTFVPPARRASPGQWPPLQSPDGRCRARPASSIAAEPCRSGFAEFLAAPSTTGTKLASWAARLVGAAAHVAASYVEFVADVLVRGPLLPAQGVEWQFRSLGETFGVGFPCHWGSQFRLPARGASMQVMAQCCEQELVLPYIAG
jgi:hypothetical protein